MPPRTTLRAAFDAGVDVRGSDECWPWTKGVDRDGYGLIGLRLTPGAKVTNHKVHVVAFTFAHGTPGGHVLHHCHSERCCNPAHLYDGDAADNAADRIAAGTVRCREVLTPQAVHAIRSEAPTTIARWRELAAEHGVSTKSIENVVKYRTWRTVS